MTIEELIEQTEKVAIYHDKDKMPEDTWHYTNELMKERYYQLTACLKELKAHREAWMNVVSAVDRHTEIHSDGELYVKNTDVKKIIAEYKPKESEQ